LEQEEEEGEEEKEEEKALGEYGPPSLSPPLPPTCLRLSSSSPSCIFKPKGQKSHR
jgi:hypothetical protein